MLILPHRPFRGRRRVRAVSPPPPPVPTTPQLVAAVYEADGPAGPCVTLTFDRGVDVLGLDGATLLVNDPGPAFTLYNGTGGMTVWSATCVRVVLIGFADPTGGGVTLNVSPGNGIVATGDGAAFAGVSDLLLPFP